MTPTSAIATGSKAIQPAGTGQTLGQTDFLRLMTAQLKEQDPFAPVDNQQLVAQMAQMSSSTGIAEMNVSLKSIADQIAANGPLAVQAILKTVRDSEGKHEEDCWADDATAADLLKQAARIVSEDSAGDWLYNGASVIAVSTAVTGFPSVNVNERLNLAQLAKSAG